MESCVIEYNERATNISTREGTSKTPRYIFRRPGVGDKNNLFVASQKLKVLTAQVEAAVLVVQVSDDWLDVVEAHSPELIAPQVEEVHVGGAHEDVRLEPRQLVAADIEFAQFVHPVERVHRDERDVVVVQLEHLQLRHLCKVVLADHRDVVVAQVEVLQTAQSVEAVAGDDGDVVVVQHELLQRGQVLERLVVHHPDHIAVEVKGAQGRQLHERVPVSTEALARSKESRDDRILSNAESNIKQFVF